MDAIKKHLIFFLLPARFLRVNFKFFYREQGKKKDFRMFVFSFFFKREKAPSGFSIQNLAITPQTSISTQSCFAGQPVFAVAAYCLNPAGRPGILVLRVPAATANRPVLLKLHHSHLQSSYHRER